MKLGWLKKLLYLLLIIAVLGGFYYAYTTGVLLNLLNWLLSQDPLMLVVVAVIGLVAMAMIIGG